MTSLGTTANSSTIIAPNAGLVLANVRVLQSALSSTTGVNPADTFTLDISTLGGAKLWYVSGNVHETLNSALYREDPTTNNTSTTNFTFTIGGAEATTRTLASSKTRSYLLVMS